MRSVVLAALALLGALIGTPRAASAQDGRILPVEDPAYEWILRLQDRGFLASLQPAALPYSIGEVRRALGAACAVIHDLGDAAPCRETDGDAAPAGRPPIMDPSVRRWIDLLRERLGEAGEGTRIAYSAEPIVRASTHRRLDPLRELGDRAHAFPAVLLSVAAGRGGIAAEASARVDAYYDLDPDGLDTALRAFSRSENTYVAYESSLAAVRLGRYGRHWGLPGEPGLVLSSNARTMDAVTLRLGGRRLALRTVFAELDAITGDGRFTGTAGDDSVASGFERRWLATHRLDWSPSSDVTFSLFESVLFSGVGSGWSLKYLNPVQPAVIETDNRPKNDENNGLLGLAIWMRRDRLRLHGQLVVDDFDFLHADERASFAASLSARLPSVRAGLDAGLDATAVASRTYNTFQPEGRYLFLNRGLATQFSDYIETSVHVRAYADGILEGLVLEPRLTGLWQGERDLRQPYLGSDNDFPTLLVGTVERTIRLALRTAWEPSSTMRLVLDAGVNQVSAWGHRPGIDRTRFSATGAVQIRFAGTRPLRLDP